MSNIDVMNAMADAYNARDLDAMMNLITDNCIMQKDRGEVLVAGKPSFRAFYADGFKNHPNLKLSVKNHYSLGSTLFVHEFNTGFLDNGVESDLETSWVYQIVDGKIALMHYFSTEYKEPAPIF